MGISINTNVGATRASTYLATNHANLQKSLDRLSSGKRITQPADDAGGLAVSMKLEHTGKVLKGVANNVSNAISLLQVQDGVLDAAGQIVARMGELRGMYDDVTKNSTDQAMYDSEYRDLKNQLNALSNTKFNGLDLFETSASQTLDVNITETGSTGPTVGVSQHNFVSDLNTAAGGGNLSDAVAANTESVNDHTSGNYTDALEKVAEFRASNGGQTKRLQFVLSSLNSQIANITAANGRIMDVDIATESSNLARQQVLVQASAAMTAQANVANDVALMLLR